jgi:hypothetical protein
MLEVQVHVSEANDRCTWGVQDSPAGVTVWAILPAPPCRPGWVNGHARSASEA